MKGLYRGFLIAMILLIVLGVALLAAGALQHTNRPRTPAATGGTIRYESEQEEIKHV